MLAIAGCFFSARERALLARLDGAKRARAFFRAWTRKEAWLKATGCGLPFGPEHVDVTLAAGEPARLLAVAGLPDAPLRWSLRDLALRPGYVAALAVPGPIARCLCHAWAWASANMTTQATASPAEWRRRFSENMPPDVPGHTAGGRSKVGRILQSLWYDAGSTTELASLIDRCATGDHLRTVCRTAKGALFGYEMYSADGCEPLSEAIVRLLSVSDAANWMRRQGFPAQSIEHAFPGAAPGCPIRQRSPTWATSTAPPTSDRSESSMSNGQRVMPADGTPCRLPGTRSRRRTPASGASSPTPLRSDRHACREGEPSH